MKFARIPHNMVASYVASGWVDLGPSAGAHGEHSSLMKWEGEGEPPAPISEEARFDRAFQSVFAEAEP